MRAMIRRAHSYARTAAWQQSDGGEQLADQAGERRETEVKEPKARDRRQETETAGETKGQRRK